MSNVPLCVLDYPALPTECEQCRRVGCIENMMEHDELRSGVEKTELPIPLPVVAPSKARGDDENSLGPRQRCGCLRTSEKLRVLLSTFPAPPPPPSPTPELKNDIGTIWAQCTNRQESTECVSANCQVPYHPIPVFPTTAEEELKNVMKQPMITLVEVKETNKNPAVVPPGRARRLSCIAALTLLQIAVLPVCFEKYDSFLEKEESNKLFQLAKELVQLVQLTITATALAMYYLVYCYMQLVYYTLRSALYFHQADGAMKITIGIVSLTSFVIAFNLIMRLEKYLGVFH